MDFTQNNSTRRTRCLDSLEGHFVTLDEIVVPDGCGDDALDTKVVEDQIKSLLQDTTDPEDSGNVEKGNHPNLVVEDGNKPTATEDTTEVMTAEEEKEEKKVYREDTVSPEEAVMLKSKYEVKPDERLLQTRTQWPR